MDRHVGRAHPPGTLRPRAGLVPAHDPGGYRPQREHGRRGELLADRAGGAEEHRRGAGGGALMLLATPADTALATFSPATLVTPDLIGGPGWPRDHALPCGSPVTQQELLTPGKLLNRRHQPGDEPVHRLQRSTRPSGVIRVRHLFLQPQKLTKGLRPFAAPRDKDVKA